MDDTRVKDKFVRKKLEILKDFGILPTMEIRKHIESLYPNEVKIEKLYS